MAMYMNLLPGDPAPYFDQRSNANPNFSFSTAAGRYLVLCFFGSSGNSRSQAALDAVKTRPDLFDDKFASFFGVTVDPEDEGQDYVADKYPGYRFFLDFDRSVSLAYGAVDQDASSQSPRPEMRRLWMVIDPTLRIMQVITFKQDQSDIAALFEYLDALPPSREFAGFELQAPIIVLPNVFERELCDRLIGLYDTHGGTESGFMQEVDGKTVAVMNRDHKSRQDYVISDNELIAELQGRFRRRVIPEIAKIHQYHATRMERYIVACYSAEEGAHFKAHRDNTTKGTAHRRFAVSVNLNEDFDGGEVNFPEYGPRHFKAPAGGAVVFSCSLLHAVSKVTRGQRFAFLPFLYDDAAAEVRKRNNQFLGEDISAYRGGEAAAKP